MCLSIQFIGTITFIGTIFPIALLVCWNNRACRGYYDPLPTVQIRSMQAEVTRILEASKIPFELIDIASGETLLEEMRSKTSNPTALPPQIFNNDVYCGDYYQLHEATENGELLQFLRL
ncbi:SH3 domain-binding glutamic acid-rich-like protein 3 [Acipenser ruthenus]|uniref:SH3 domain-binding glutamic acid-rich-like protein 3 n=1 Tax=Acipenser ruthenus TaxID=7906 RepID=UPI0027424F16|nr:SH3 domain-binding glutamic acid-rich-like protein 3 [Acipenser ruthenus]